MCACRLCGNLSVKPPSPDTKTAISVWKYLCALKRRFQQRGVSFLSYLCQLRLPSLPEKMAGWFRIISGDASSSPQGCLKLVIPSAFTTASRHTGRWVQGRAVTVLVGQNGSPSTASSCKYIMQRELEVLELSKGSNIAHSPWMLE